MSREANLYRARLEAAKAASVGHRLVRCARLFNEAALRQLRASDPRLAFVRPVHLTLMPHLDLEGTRLVDLARRVEMSKQALAPYVEELERHGMVNKQPDPTDGRAKGIVFTDLGREFLLVGLRAIAAVESEVLELLNPEEREQLDEGLKAVEQKLEARAPRT